MPTLNVNHFSYNKATRTLSAEASMLERQTAFCGQTTFELKNFKTGNTVVMTITRTIFDYSGEDLQAWEYEPVDPKAPINKVIIFND